MATVSGFWPTVLFGLIGALLAEMIRLAELLRGKHPLPDGQEMLGSLLYVMAGGFVFLFGWNQPEKMISVAALGAAFPFTFSGLVRAKQAGEHPPSGTTETQPRAGSLGSGFARTRSWLDYMGSQF